MNIEEISKVKAPARSGGWFSKIKRVLFKTSSRISQGIAEIFGKKKISPEVLIEFEDFLLSCDIDHSTATLMVEKIRQLKLQNQQEGKGLINIINKELRQLIIEIIEPVSSPIDVQQKGLQVLLLCGINGNGKTTTLAKLAYKFKRQGKKVLIAAADTFRAAAVEQLQEWADKLNIPIITGNNEEAAAVAFKAVEVAYRDEYDILLIDTAGRLHNNTNLMEELKKIVRVIKKHDPGAPHYSILVLDATVGQNALNQLENFNKAINISSIIMTKLDGTAKGGMLISLARKNPEIKICAIGTGEKIEDLEDFDAIEFANSLFDNQ